MAEERFYKRAVRVTGFAPRPSAVSPFGAYLEDTVPAVVIRDLRVQFNITKSVAKKKSKKSPNTCDLSITNLAEATRGFFQQRPFRVELAAGYGDDLKYLFRGDVKWGESKQVGTEWQTELQLLDGDRAFRHARLNRSYSGGTKVLTALQEAARSMGAALPPGLQNITEFQKEMSAGFALYGNTGTALTKLLSPLGFAWSIQDGELQILKDGETTPGEGPLINEQAGLIGTPEFGPPSKPGKKPRLTLKTFLYASLKVGQRIFVESRQVNGTFRIERLQHTGDTHGDEWTTEIEAIEV
jgi:hypothetical protein